MIGGRTWGFILVDVRTSWRFASDFTVSNLFETVQSAWYSLVTEYHGLSNYTSNITIAYKLRSKTDSFNDKPNISVSNEKIESRNADSTTSARKTPEPEIAISLAKQEIGVGNIDSLVAQKRALLVCKVHQL